MFDRFLIQISSLLVQMPKLPLVWRVEEPLSKWIWRRHCARKWAVQQAGKRMGSDS